MNYHCPVCVLKKEVQAKCRLEAEIKAKKEAELRAKEKMEREREERGQADEIAGAVYEFFAFLLPSATEMAQLPGIHQEIDTDPLTDLMSVPSPDSITVTTVFGVQEEPSNVTIITSSGSPTGPNTHEEPQIDTSPETLAEQLVQLHFPDHSTPSLEAEPLPVEPESIDLMEDDADDADIDTDDFDAESAVIDEFIDDGALTPTTTTTASNA